MKKLSFSKGMAGLLAMFISLSAFAQNEVTSRIWKPINASEVVATGERYTIPSAYKTLRMDKTEMQNLLAKAPREPVQTAMLTNGLLFEMPMPDGSYERFQIFEYSMMEPGLAAKLPGIKTYTGQGIDDAAATIKLDVTYLGFHAMVRSPKGSFFIDPYNMSTTTDYICYDKKNLQRTSVFSCDQVGEMKLDAAGSNSLNRTHGTQLRTYRLALACTGEYAAFFGGTVNGAASGMTTTMNRVNGVYESELSVRMVLVANNNSLIYTNASTDPYTNGSGSTMLGQNQTNCDAVIGTANYDIGHVVSTGGGGVAGLGVVCSSGNKARGVTGSGSPTGDAFDIDYVAHEMGHQFAGNHTFNSVTGSCNGNRSSGAAYEPGSGITIQAYAGICGSDNLASNSIAYFHGYSLDEMITFITTGNGNSCAAITSTGNTAPVITSMAYNCSIPISTPFTLTGGATDANGDVITYSWEERDLGTAGAWNTQSTTAPQFRTFTPVTSASRTFPKLSDIINNTTTIGELLPNQARTLKFRLTARDSRAGGGGIMHPDTNVTISVINTGAAFAVTTPNTAVTWVGGSTQTVTWNVSGTTANGINTANVKISLSTDGGNTFPTILLASTANDGTESVTVPNTATTTARVKVEAIGNIFFDMSNANFTITASTGLTSIATSAVSPLTYCAGAAVSVPFTTNGAANASNVFRAVLSDASGSFANADTIGTLTSTTAGTISATLPSGLTGGNGYRIRVVSSNPAVTGSDNGSNITINALPGAAGSIGTAFTTFCGGLPITFGTGSIANATGYNWTFPSGAAISSGQGTQSCVIAFPSSGVSGNVTVTGTNSCGNGTPSALAVTANPVPPTPTANNVSGCAGTPIALSGSPAGGSFSVSNPYSGSSTSYTYTVMNGFGCVATSAAASITVNNSPAVSVTGNTSFCQGTTSQLCATAGLSSYFWSTGATTPCVNVNTAGTYTVTVSNANGCTNTTLVTTTVNSNPNPSISGSTSFCSGSSTTLNAGSGYSAYLWSTGATTQNINVNTAAAFTVTVTNANGCNGSTSVTTTVNSNLTPVISGNTAFCAGGSSVLDAGSGYSSYIWSTGATTQSINVNTAGTFSVTVSNVSGCTGSASVSTTVNALPAATTSPSGNVSTCNASQILTANTGSGLTYQWQNNGVNINGATASSYNATTSGNYRVVVTNAALCSATSSAVTLSLGALSATVTPAGPLSVCAGTQVTLSAPTGTGYSYQWFRNNVNLNAPVSAIAVGDAGTYRCVLTSGTCSATSNNVTLTVINNPTPVITNTTPLTFCSPGSVFLSGNSFANTTYQWQLGSVDIAGATSPGLTATLAGTYRVIHTANGCSKSAKVTVVAATSVTAVISTNDPTTLCSGGVVNMSVVNAIPGYSYQWRNNGVDISGATSTTYQANATGVYSCLISASCGSTISNNIAVSIGTFSALVAPSGQVPICAGSSLTLSANTGTGFTYQWRNNGVDISGATSSTYTATGAGLYSVSMTSPCGNGTSAETELVLTTVTASVTPAGTVSACTGIAQTFTANSGAGYTYQWYKNNVLIAGATTDSYSTPNDGNYKVVVALSGGICPVTSAATQFIVINNPTPTITPSAALTACTGSTVTFSTNTYSGVTYQWQKDGANIAGATSQTYNAALTGTYRVSQTANGCSKFTPKVKVTFAPCRANGSLIEAEDERTIVVSPNPFSTTAQLEIDEALEVKNASIELYNMMGDVVKRIENINSNSITITNQKMKAGMYLLRLVNEDGTILNKRVVVN